MNSDFVSVEEVLTASTSKPEPLAAYRYVSISISFNIYIIFFKIFSELAHVLELNSVTLRGSSATWKLIAS